MLRHSTPPSARPFDVLHDSHAHRQDRHVRPLAGSDAHDHPRARSGYLRSGRLSGGCDTSAKNGPDGSPRGSKRFAGLAPQARYGLLSVMTIIGWARVSPAERNPDLPVDAPRAAGIGRAFVGKARGDEFINRCCPWAPTDRLVHVLAIGISMSAGSHCWTRVSSASTR